MIEYQHGNPNVVNDYSLFSSAKNIIEVTLDNKEEVFIKEIDALTIGEAAMVLGAGRQTLEDVIDHAVGIKLLKKIGDKITVNEPVALVYSNGKNENLSISKIQEAYKYTKDEVKSRNIIIKVVR